MSIFKVFFVTNDYKANNKDINCIQVEGIGSKELQYKININLRTHFPGQVITNFNCASHLPLTDCTPLQVACNRDNIKWPSGQGPEPENRWSGLGFKPHCDHKLELFPGSTFVQHLGHVRKLPTGLQLGFTTL